MLVELQHLPAAWQANAGLALCHARLSELSAVREFAVMPDAIDAEIDRVKLMASYWHDVWIARDSACSIACRREAIQHARQLVGDAAWFSGAPVPICP
jgi:hypothetical protein